MWDLCCDHGYLAFKAYESTHFPEVHLVDQAVHLIAAAEERFRQYVTPLENQLIHFHPLPGEKLERNVDGNVVIAGVGAVTTQSILEGLLAKGHLVGERLLLVPQKDIEQLEASLTQWDNFNEHYELEQCVPFFEKHRERKLLIFRRKIGRN